MPLPTPQDLAIKFSEVIREWLGDDLIAANWLNRTAYRNRDSCGTQDFCDANTAMLEAMESFGINDYDGTDETNNLINAAWGIAKADEFHCKRTTPMSTDWIREAKDDALSMIDNFEDEIAEQARDGEVSDDLNNKYSGGDSYHHENHVDKSYSLTEAAELLDRLSDHEESDSGMWQSLPPREAISAQAAYTYGNAVMSAWSDEIKDINKLIGGFDFEEGDDEEAIREGAARLYILLENNYRDGLKDEQVLRERFAIAEKARYELSARSEFTAALVLADHCDEKQPTAEYLAKRIRAAATLMQAKQPLFLMMRLGDGADYEEHEDIGDAASVLSEAGVRSVRRCNTYGVEADGFKGKNYISIFWTSEDEKPDAVRELSDVEIEDLNAALAAMADPHGAMEAEVKA